MKTDAFERAKSAYGTGAYDDATLEFVFPELKESEDERIRKEIVSALKFANDGGVYDKHIAYLKKQKEQKEIPLMNGDADLYFDEWNQQNQNPTKRQCFEEGMRYAQKLQKDVKVKYVYPKFRIGDIISYNKPESGFNDYTIVGFNNEMPDYLVDGGNIPSCSIGIEFIDSNYHLKEQQPADLSEMMVHKEPYIAPVPTPMVADEQKPAKPTGKLSREECLYQLLIDQLITYSDYEYLTGKKPAEWKPQSESLEALMYAIEGKWEMIKPTSYLSRRLEDLYDGLVNTYNVDETFIAKLPK